ncbi:MAG: hypothetical protein AAFX80_14545, partial [Cyanobacteria bacterium J06639_18]
MKNAFLKYLFWEYLFSCTGKHNKFQESPRKGQKNWANTILLTCKILLVSVFCAPLTVNAAEVTEQLHGSPYVRNSFQLREEGDRQVSLARRELQQGKPDSAVNL